MSTSNAIQMGLEDLLADLQHARRSQQLGRLALLAYCEVKTWARQAGKPDIADGATKMFTQTPCVCKEEFLSNIDSLIATLECHHRSYQRFDGGFSGAEVAVAQGRDRSFS
jgi:hypothetical protein